MRILLKLPKASAHWIGMANLINQSDGLRGDVTLVVGGDDVRFLDDDNCEIAMPSSMAAWVLHAPDSLHGKLGLFQWLHERFPKPEVAMAATQPALRVLPPFHRSGRVTRTIRFSEVPSTR